MPDRYFTARPRFVREIFFPFVFVRACTCKSLPLADFYSRLSHFRRGDDAKASCVSRWLFGVIEGSPPPGWCKLNRKRLLGLYIFQRCSSPVIHESSFYLGFCSGRCPLFWRISQSIGKFIRSQRVAAAKEANGSDTKMHSWSRFVKIATNNQSSTNKERMFQIIIGFACNFLMFLVYFMILYFYNFLNYKNKF